MLFLCRCPEGFSFKRLILVSFITIVASTLLPFCSQAQQKSIAANPDAFWTSRVEPLLDRQCLKCHVGVRQQGSLDLRSLDTILRGGGSGPAIIPGRPNESRILQFIAPKSEMHMPPAPKKQLPPEEIGVLKTWIATGRRPMERRICASGASWNTGQCAWVGEGSITHVTGVGAGRLFELASHYIDPNA